MAEEQDGVSNEKDGKLLVEADTQSTEPNAQDNKVGALKGDFAVALKEKASLEDGALNDRMRELKESLRQDFLGNGIVVIGEDIDSSGYETALRADRRAGKTWDDIEARLLDNDSALLKKAAEMPGGAQLIGVHPDGTLEMRSREMVSARWLEDAETGERVLRLLPHSKAMAEDKSARGNPSRLSRHAMAQEQEKWATTAEILRAVTEAGYHVPADAHDYEKKGLVAASEAITGDPYVVSEEGDEHQRAAVLEFPKDLVDGGYVRVVRFDPSTGKTSIDYGFADTRSAYQGAVLWLRG